MKKLFSIGEVAKIKGITIKALRYYHKMGILIPSYIDEFTGYRYYSIEQFIYIDVIKGCRALGTSISELQEIFKECDTEKLLEFLKQKRIEAEENIIKMQDIIENIDKLNSSVLYSKKVLCNSNIEIKYFEERHIVVMPFEDEGNLNELIYYSNLDKKVEENNLDITMEKGIIYNVNSGGVIEPVYVFNIIKCDFNLIDKEYIKVLPKGNYLTMSYNKDNEYERVNKLIEYAKEHDLEINSFMELELFDDLFNVDYYSCQIQMLVEGNKIFR